MYYLAIYTHRFLHEAIALITAASFVSLLTKKRIFRSNLLNFSIPLSLLLLSISKILKKHFKNSLEKKIIGEI